MDSYNAAAAGGIAIFFIFFGAIVIAAIVCEIIGTWKTVNKLGGAGWSQIIPVYNCYELSRSVGADQKLVIAYTVLSAITVVGSAASSSLSDGTNIISTLAGFCSLATFAIGIIITNMVSKRFGKGTGFTVGLVLLPCIFYMILGCGSAEPAEK